MGKNTNKLASYLNQHLIGRSITSQPVLKAFSTDESPLTYMPELVVYPKNTSDIRKVAKFCWQLAEKGHSLPITARGSGSDKTGAAIGSGIILPMRAYMDQIFEIDAKQKLIRLQPGVSVRSANAALKSRGLGLPSLVGVMSNATIGGAVANNRRGPYSGKYGATEKYVHQLEVVLSSGEVLQTERISKRQLNQKKGLATFEGDIYRQIDGLINDYAKVIEEQIAGDYVDRRGYGAIAEVRKKDGSFDLTPLIIGSQGTLGVVSEMILKADFVSSAVDAMAISFENLDETRDAIEILSKTKPASLEFYDGELFKLAKKRGLVSEAINAVAPVDDGALLLVTYDEFGERARQRKLSKATKLLANINSKIEIGAREDALKLLSIRDMATATLMPESSREAALPLFDGVWIALERFDGFKAGLGKLARKHRVDLPLYGSALEGIYSTRPILNLSKVGDKQKIFKITDEYEKLVTSCGGQFVAEAGEGRFKATISYRKLDPEILKLYAAIKNVFDPHNILNPGVKQPVEIKELIAHLRTDNDLKQVAEFNAI